MSVISFTVDGFDELDADLQALSARATDPVQLLADMYLDFLDVETARFAAEGPGWPQLKPATLQRKAAQGYPSTILEETGAMRRSLTEPDAPGAIETVTAAGLIAGTDYRSDRQTGRWADTALAAFHQYGTTNGVPVRKSIDIGVATIAEWAAAVATYMVTGIDGLISLP